MPQTAADRFPTRHLPGVTVRELPPPPGSAWPIIGPGVIAAGVGLASGEFVLYPYIASQVGLVFLWAAAVGIVTQWFLNMEIERYTLATGETALTGFSRFWRHWGLVFAVMVYFANLWPGWASSSATMVTYLVGGDVTWISIGMLLVIGATLTLAPVVYQALERVEFVKVGLVVLFIGVAVVFAISADTWGELPRTVTAPDFPTELGFALMLSALVFAGAGGGQNLVQSNWIRDKGYGMGAYVPRLVSPVTGREEAAGGAAGFVFEPTEENLRRWRRWWRLANREQLVTFVLISFVTITLMSMLAYSTVYGVPGLANSVSFLEVEGNRLKELVGPWFGTLFWLIGALSLFAAALGIVDYTSRLAADVLKTSYLRGRSESRIYFALVWGLVVIGCLILLAGLSQPLPLLVISACVGGLMMFVYSILLLVLNRRVLPEQIRPRRYRVAALIWAVLLFGVFSVLTIWQQGGELLRWLGR
ncbi:MULTISPECIES: Nramp family divalent metal transporter [Micromonospora]|uniref:Mn2+ and Fe2+ transporters of the NRAMP family n=1 Tax=Micromonospora yangpuensis TaxID=683228 RepID=A0A1C6UH11_9ACTN|nr:Nramp family divalent metal transporter [Micromonospora yangpuensis]GGM04295.1 iron transporter [Micromonospora yangpuensis]SCL53327.1 Mn2+ and Fe2+ transporters of the NRAMP family [Micromonospora yangpuensis]